MVLCVETPYYELGWGGMMVEDIIVIGKSGNESLTKLPRELWRVG
jgi:Xaa-Pro aminopeptidase